MRALSSLVVRLAAWFVPADQRHEWRREWLAELEAAVARPEGSPADWRFALGAPRHAWALRRSTVGSTWLDLRFGVRWLRRRPAFSAAAITTLALGIGATVGLFSVAHAVLWKPMPYRDPDRLVQFFETNPARGWTEATIAPGNLISWRERLRSFESIAFYIGSDTRGAGLTSLTLTGDEPRRIRALGISPNFFEVLGVPPLHGRTFTETDALPGATRVVVVSYGFWSRDLGADPAVVGRTIPINGSMRQVIGVLDSSFEFDLQAIDMFVLIAFDEAEQREIRVPHWLRAIGRLKAGVSADDARRDLETVALALEREHPDSNRQMGAGFLPVTEWFVGPSRRPILLFLLGVGVLLLLACSNVTGLLLSRAIDRRREFAVRASLGASGFRLVRQLLIEAALLGSAGTALGAALAAAFVALVVRYAPPDVPRLAGIELNTTVAWFAVALAALVTILAGLAPALHAVRSDLRDAATDGARGTSGRSSALRRLLVGTQVALATVLLVATFLTGRSVRALTAVDPGFAVDGLFSARLDLPGRYEDAGRDAAFFESLAAALRAMPGITAAGATAELPLGGLRWTGDLYVEGQPEVHGRELRHKSVTTGYLEALGVRLLAGRAFTDEDGPAAPPVVVANEALVRMYFDGRDPIGKRIAFDRPNERVRWRTIIGVVSGELQDGLAHAANPEVYEAVRQETTTQMALLVRSARPAAEVIGVVRATARALDPGLALYDEAPFAAAVDRALAPSRVSAALVSVFGGVALVLAAIGIYGVAAQSVAARTREIGVRVAFGASRQDVTTLILRQELATLAGGSLAGLGLALLAGRLAESLLYGVRAADPTSLGGGMAVLAAGAVVALLLPARRALRIDPVAALRQD